MSNGDRKEYLNFTIIIIACLIILGVTAIYIYRINFADDTYGFLARQGRLDLQDWDMDKNIKLDGEWEFYPKALLEPGDFDKSINEKTYIKVPGSWDSSMGNRPEGFATYRMSVDLPKDGLYALKTRTIRLANKIYINGKEVSQVGQVAPNVNEFIPGSKFVIGSAHSQDRQLEIIIHVSSFSFGSGGIIKSIEFGRFEKIMLSSNKSRALDVFAISVCLVLGIYFLLIYLQRKAEKYLLYFSLTNLVTAFYYSTMNEQVLDLIYDYDFITRTRLQMFGIVLTSVFLLKFAHYFIMECSKKKIVNTITFINLAVLLFALIRFKSMQDPIAPMYRGAIILGYGTSYIYIFSLLIKSFNRRVRYPTYIWVIMVSLIIYWILMALKIYSDLDLGHLQTILTIFMFSGVASLLSHRQHQEYQEMNYLSNKLMVDDKLKDNFLASASHELRTPLHVIMNLTKSLIEGKKGTLNSDQREDLFFINHEGERLARLINDLLDASQIKQGKVNLRIGPIKPHGLVNGIIKEMNFLLPDNKDIVMYNQIPEDFPLLEADPDKFVQIIYNLLSNAIKYTDQGEIKISAYLQDDSGYIEVRDTGHGIKKDELEYIFDIFYQNEKDQSNHMGLGLGLAIVKHLVEIQGGNIDVESTYGQGSVFRFSLPLYKDSKTEAQVVRPISSKYHIEKHFIVDKLEKISYELGSKFTILIVDDEPSNLKVMSDIAKSLGFSTFLAETGREAIEIVRERKVDLLLLDFMLPDMSGAQVCREIRRQYSMIELPIMVLTASGRNSDLLAAFEHGANDFIKKPANADELVSRIQSLILMKSSVEEGLAKEFQYFYSQISPHFLYNTLNTIIGLSYKDSEKARQALNNLSIYFRGKLELHQEKILVSLEDEVELVKAYLEIEQMRYGQSLKVEYKIDENIFAMIPPLSLQPLVENSIRHGLSAKEGDKRLTISIKMQDGKVEITIEDNGIGMSKEKQEELMGGLSKRLGFKNVLEKIKLIRGARLDLESQESKGTKIRIIIPGECSYESSIS